MAVTREQVIEYLSALSPDRLHELMLELEDLWGIERPATEPCRVTMGVAWPWDGSGEQTDWRVILLDPGPQRIAVMRAIREHFPGLSLGEVRALVDSAPVEVHDSLERRSAEDLRERLMAVGASVELR